MKIVFISNFFNHHQASLSEKLYELTMGSYRFIATTSVPQERKKIGYSEVTAPYVIEYHTNMEQQIQARALIDHADVVIIGSAPESLLKNRKKEKKIIIRYSERPLKKEGSWWKYPLRWIRWHWNNPGNLPIYMLCASAYTASDYRKFGLFQGRALRWGYFPECRRYTDIEQVLSRKEPAELLWCGRFLNWKHPDDALAVAQRLKADGYAFRLNFIGTGEMEQTLQNMVRDWDISDVVSFLGAKPSGEVRDRMERAGIYLFTSDRMEGWGAVLNEAMNSGCAVIASRDAGSTPYLIKDGENGLCFDAGNVDVLYEKTKYLLEHPDAQKSLGRMAYETIIHEWNPETAAQRLVEVIDCLLRGRDTVDIYDRGPCSRA